MPRYDRSILNDILPPEERAIEAVVARYQRVAPAVTRIARTLANNDELIVRLGSQAAVSANEIIIDPGVFQAAYARSAPVTPTEVALTSALHEVIHLIATNFEEKRPLPKSWSIEDPTDSAKEPPPLVDDLFLLAYEEGQEEEKDETVTHESGFPVESPEDPVSLLEAIYRTGGTPAEALFLALEDARQEWRFFDPYPGARSVLVDLYRASIQQAMRDTTPLGQFSLAAFMLIGGHLERNEIDHHVDPKVVALLHESSELILTARDTEDPWDVGTLTLTLLEIAHQHGITSQIKKSDTPSMRQTKEQADASAISASIDAVRMLTPPLASAKAYDQTRQATQSISASEGRAGDSDQAGDPATDQLVRVSEAPTIYLPTGQGGKLVISPFPEKFEDFGADGRELIEKTALRWGVAQRSVGRELYPLFVANQRRGLRSGYDAGDLSPYAALLLGAGLYARMFERRDLPTRRSYAVSLLVDGSASMLQPRDAAKDQKTPWALTAATLGAWTLARLCDELQIDFEVTIFNRSFPATADDTEATYRERRHRATGGLRRSQGGAAERLTRTVNHYVVKNFEVPWGRVEDVMAGLFFVAASPGEAAHRARFNPDDAPPVAMFDKAANVDEFNVAFAAERLARRRVSTRILVVLADGMTRGSVHSLAKAVDAAEDDGTVVLGIGIGDETVEAAYRRSQVVVRPDELARAMVDGVRSTLYRTIATVGGHTWWTHSSEQVLYDQSFTRSSIDG